MWTIGTVTPNVIVPSLFSFQQNLFKLLNPDPPFFFSVDTSDWWSLLYPPFYLNHTALIFGKCLYVFTF